MKDGKTTPIIELGDLFNRLSLRVAKLEETAATREQLNKAHDRLTITVQHLNEGLAELFRRLDEKDGNK